MSHTQIKKPPLDLPYYNSTTYPLAIKGQLASTDFNEEEANKLRYHQFIVKEFFTRNVHQRGILICHGMGQGKTRLAVAIADYMRTYDKHRKVIVLSAKSLESNFRKELYAFNGRDDNYVNQNYKFISLNSNNMFKKINTVDKSDETNELENKLGDFMEDVIRDSSLENSMLIIDEAHNLFNSITNGAKNAVALYDLIMETKNMKLIFMSGTPIINNPFELVPCYNMLRGRIPIDVKHGSAENVKHGSAEDDKDDTNVDNVEDNTNVEDDKDNTDVEDTQDDTDVDDTADTNKDNTRNRSDNRNRSKFSRPKYSDKHKQPNTSKQHTTTLFSEDIDEFEDYFVDKVNKTIKNKDKFTNRIFGLSSYYSDLYFRTDEAKQGFPTELETIVEKVPMSQMQFARYMSARILEQDESKLSYRASSSRFSSSSGGSSTYRVKSRQISNYCIPEYALGPARGYKSREKFISKIKLEDLKNLADHSPKMAKIVDNINLHPNQKGIVYSQFVSGEGIAIFSLVLKSLGYQLYSDVVDADYDLPNIDVAHNTTRNKKDKTFAVLSGAIDPELRAEIIRKFNEPDSNIDLLLLSGAVAEGIDLKRVRHVHVMEPFWNYARINQVKTRAIRYLSHVDLPENERNVQVYIYLSDYPVETNKAKINEQTTDLDLYTKSIDNMFIINTFLSAIAESSFDCSLHYNTLDESIKEKIKCKLCSPDNHILFHPLVKKDMDLPNTCRPYSDKKVTVQSIQLPNINEKFYFNKVGDDVKLYHFNKKLNGYAPVLRSHPLYADIMAAAILGDGS